MTDLFRRHGLLISWLLLLMASSQLMAASIRNPSLPRFGGQAVTSVLFPVEKLYHEVSESTKYLWRHYIWLLEVESERNVLYQRIKELEALNSRLTEYEGENHRLRRLLQFSTQSGFHGVVGTVVGRDPSNWIKTITIDRGSLDGVRPGLAVVDGNAIVGQTTAVGPQSSKVLLLIDATSGIDAILQSNRASGIIEGGGPNGLLRMRYVEKLKHIEVKPGDRVVASGLDRVYPKGALVGIVERVDPTTSSMFYDIEVRPSVDLDRLENGLVIVPEKTKAPVVPVQRLSTRPESPVPPQESLVPALPEGALFEVPQ